MWKIKWCGTTGFLLFTNYWFVNYKEEDLIRRVLGSSKAEEPISICCLKLLI